MRNWRDGPDDIPSRGKACDPPGSAQPRRIEACGQVCVPKNRPCRRRGIAAYPNLPWSNLTPDRADTRLRRSRLGPHGRVGRRCSRRPILRRGGSAEYVEIALSLISTRLLEVISALPAENEKKLREAVTDQISTANSGGRARWTSGSDPASRAVRRSHQFAHPGQRI